MDNQQVLLNTAVPFFGWLQQAICAFKFYPEEQYDS